MICLANVRILERHVPHGTLSRIREMFGTVSFGMQTPKEEYELEFILRGPIRCGAGGHKEMFFIVPNNNVRDVWTHDFACVRIGTATHRNSTEPITHGVGITVADTVLYICLSTRGEEIAPGDSFGV